MKIQSLAVIFIIIILPISILLSEYLQAQIDTLNLQTLYDSRLTGATYDAVKAFQLNAMNNTSNDISSSKIRDIEASATTFLTSIANNFASSGTSRTEIQGYVPAIVYCLYDGYYIYSPYKNDIRDINIVEEDATYKQNGEKITGVKPYIYYSCKYNNGIVITYSLDNYITIQGKVGDEYWNKSGYILDKAKIEGDKVTYNGIEITKTERLEEYIYDTDKSDIVKYPYVKSNGTKYYYDSSTDLDRQIFYIQNGKKMYAISTSKEYTYYKNKIENNQSAYNFYKKAAEFTQEVKSKLSGLSFGDAVDVSGLQIRNQDGQGVNGLSGVEKIFGGTSDAENSDSNFTEHRTAVIRYAIEKNLTTAIANYNNNFAENSASAGNLRCQI